MLGAVEKQDKGFAPLHLCKRKSKTRTLEELSKDAPVVAEKGFVGCGRKRKKVIRQEEPCLVAPSSQSNSRLVYRCIDQFVNMFDPSEVNHLVICFIPPDFSTRGKRVLGIAYDEDDNMARRHCAMKRAEEFRAHLQNEYPNFIQSMLPSQVTGGFWMGLPKMFCSLYMPDDDITVNLIDEAGDCYETVFLARRNGLSGGWRKFSLSHGLLVGDALVFQLDELYKFKVFIVRAYSLCSIDGVLALMALTDGKRGAKIGMLINQAAAKDKVLRFFVDVDDDHVRNGVIKARPAAIAHMNTMTQD